MKRKTIRKHADFLTPKDGPNITFDNVVSVRIKNAKIQDDARYGIIASKRLFRFAVQRNRVKRLLRDWIFYNEDLMLPEFDYVFIAGAEILNTNRENGREYIKRALTKISQNYAEKTI
jgi:ribonuclease P protein component